MPKYEVFFKYPAEKKLKPVRIKSIHADSVNHVKWRLQQKYKGAGWFTILEKLR